MDMAVKMGAPMIGLNDSGGARIQERHWAVMLIFLLEKCASKRCNFCHYGPYAGGAVYSPAMTDFTMMVEALVICLLPDPM
jgi:propionyl-CoA carboxylase beta chain